MYQLTQLKCSTLGSRESDAKKEKKKRKAGHMPDHEDYQVKHGAPPLTLTC